jgi:transposase
MAKSTKTHRVPEVRQASLLEVPESRSPHPVIETVRFDMGDRARLFVGTVALDKYLEAEGLSWVLKLATLLGELDWKPFETAYKPGGRPPIHPRLMVGLILYGMMLKQVSLRQLEALSKRDIGAWWMAGGLTPDFSTFTRFIQRHREVLSEDFFVKTTWLIVKRLKLGKGTVAIDGTVMQSAASTATALKKEALVEQLEAARDAGDGADVERLGKAVDAVEERAAARDAAGKDGGTIKVSVQEPEAVLQPKKNSRDHQLAYKPTVAAHSSGIIVGQALSPTSETECVPAVLAQHERVFGAQPERLMADAGFHTLAVLDFCVQRGLDALIPSGRGSAERRTKKGHFPKSAFPWDAEAMRPRCPAGRLMSGGQTVQRDRHGREYREYRASNCARCPLRAQCTDAKERGIKLYEGDELKAAMSEVMRHPAAKKAFRQRSAIVEPVFARMRNSGFNRFRRRGRANARLELSLNCVAHNLRLLLWSRRGVFVVLCFTRRSGEPWNVAAVGVAIHQR